MITRLIFDDKNDLLAAFAQATSSTIANKEQALAELSAWQNRRVYAGVDSYNYAVSSPLLTKEAISKMNTMLSAIGDGTLIAEDFFAPSSAAVVEMLYIRQSIIASLSNRVSPTVATSWATSYLNIYYA